MSLLWSQGEVTIPLAPFCVADNVRRCSCPAARRRASLCRAAGAGDASSHPNPASGVRKARQTKGKHWVASEAAEQLPRPLNTRKEAIAENAECKSQYVRKSPVGFCGKQGLFLLVTVAACELHPHWIQQGCVGRDGVRIRKGRKPLFCKQ